ncbi:MAG: catalase [Leptospiraceae bacterium]|nr:catalase [Leptospiraceae bacterium]
MKTPNKDWREEIASDEDKRFQEYSEKIIEVQRKKSKLFGNGRALHRKQLCGLKANFQVLDNLPDYAKQGLFASPANYNAWIRISNGGVDVKSDSAPDIRGFAIKVLGLNGPSALGNGNTQHQDFTLINQPAFAFSKSAPFISLVLAASESPFALVKHLFGSYGFFGGIQKVTATAKTFGRPFSGFLTETFYSAAPIACGEYAARVRLVSKLNKSNYTSNKSDLSLDIKNILTKEEVVFDLQLQFFVDEKITPIEDASVDWDETEAPYITVAKLTIPKQDFDSEEGKKLSLETEKTFFDPWNALLSHRPLGDVMRTRKYIYYASQKERGANK